MKQLKIKNKNKGQKYQVYTTYKIKAKLALPKLGWGLDKLQVSPLVCEEVDVGDTFQFALIKLVEIIIVWDFLGLLKWELVNGNDVESPGYLV